MNIEKFMISYLSEKLDIPVYGERPNMATAPDEFVTVEKTGSSRENFVIKCDLAVQSWSTSRINAAELNEKVINILEAATECPEISRCHCDNDYNYTDLTSKRPRYQALFEVVYQ